MSKTDAAYMRAYRARRKAMIAGLIEDREQNLALVHEMDGSARIAELEDALARHHVFEPRYFLNGPNRMVQGLCRCGVTDGEPRITGGFNTRPFTPVPKKRHG